METHCRPLGTLSPWVPKAPGVRFLHRLSGKQPTRKGGARGTTHASEVAATTTPSPWEPRQPLHGTRPQWAASPRRVLSHGEAARRAGGRRAGDHVAGATTTTAGVRRRPGAAGPVPAPRPGFPAACRPGLRARSLARTARCPKT